MEHNLSLTTADMFINTQITYGVYIDYLHRNSMFYPDLAAKGVPPFQLYFYFTLYNVEEHLESLVYDLGSFWHRPVEILDLFWDSRVSQ